MPESNQLRRTSNALLLFLVLLIPSLAHADAILPCLALIWPITILLLIPIVLIEALYSRNRLQLGFWESIRVVGVANVLSSIAGLPIANLFAAGLQYVLESVYFHDINKLHEQATRLLVVEPNRLTRHDYLALHFFGLYPRWILLVSAVTMVVICFLVSWWIEALWVRRYLAKKKTPSSERQSCSTVIRNANVLSYVFVLLFSVWALMTLWPSSMSVMAH
jgi:hypothetical protein